MVATLAGGASNMGHTSPSHCELLIDRYASVPADPLFTR